MRVLVAEGYADRRIEAIPEDLREPVSARGRWDDYVEIHGGPLASAAKRQEGEVLAALGLLEEALRRGKAVLATYPPRTWATTRAAEACSTLSPIWPRGWAPPWLRWTHTSPGGLGSSI
ncbi:hypothetical protein [Thermoproteus uzoniensis]|uniref:hypothetical protein n=1 Tax=Thermoproteus uzoniensis TaxID=184117 RepID=UPI003B830467